jgi:hypothetical protein
MKSTLLLSAILFLFYTGQAQEKPTKYEKIGMDWTREQIIVLKKKENFRTGCDTSKMTATILQTKYETMGGESGYGNARIAKQQKQVDKHQATNIGIDGCNQKSVYIFTGNGWFLNSSEEKKQ